LEKEIQPHGVGIVTIPRLLGYLSLKCRIVPYTMGRLCRDLQRSTHKEHFSDDDFEDIFNAQNNTPRKCLGFKTPAEIFHSDLIALHWIYQSIPRAFLHARKFDQIVVKLSSRNPFPVIAASP
jgi:hypothetical protein